MDGKSEDWNTRTLGKARPRVDAAMIFWEFTLVLPRFDLSLESREFRVLPSTAITFWRANSRNQRLKGMLNTLRTTDLGSNWRKSC